MLGLDQFIDHCGGRGESNPPLLPASSHTQSRCQMALPRSAFTDQHHRFVSLNVSAFGQFADLRRRNLPRLVEVKFLQRF